MSQAVVYAVYYTAATSGHPTGYVWNNIIASSPGAIAITGSAAVDDADRTYPIGSIYPVSSVQSQNA